MNKYLVALALILGLGLVNGEAAAGNGKRNFAPVIRGTPATTATVGTAYSFQPTASDKNGDPLVFAIQNMPGWTTFDTATGRLAGIPATAGSYANIRISVSDGRSSSSLAAFTITVTAPAATNHPPTISGTPATSVDQGSAYAFQPSATDPDGQPLAFAIQNKPAWATFEIATGRLAGTPPTTGSSSNIVISVSDGLATSSLPSFGITVTAPVVANNPPTISGTPATSVNQGTAYLFQPAASDPEGQPLTFSIQNKPAWAAFDTATGRLAGTPGSADVGTYAAITVQVSDGANIAALPAFALTVNQVASGQITVSWTAPQQNTDGSPLTDLAGYRLYYGTSATSPTSMVSLGTNLSSYVIQNLAAGTYYVSMTALNAQGIESSRSAAAAKSVL